MDEQAPNQGGQGSESNSSGLSSGNPAPRQDGTGLRELALRLATTRLMGMPRVSEQAEPQLFIGELPPGLPLTLPQPDGSRVVGSVRLGSTTTIYLDAGESPAQVFAFYRERLSEQGWRTYPQWRASGHGGFVPSVGPMTSRVMFCRGEDAPSLALIAYDRPGRATEVQLELNTFAENPEMSPCVQERRMRGGLTGPQTQDISFEPSLSLNRPAFCLIAAQQHDGRLG